MVSRQFDLGTDLGDETLNLGSSKGENNVVWEGEAVAAHSTGKGRGARRWEGEIALGGGGAAEDEHRVAAGVLVEVGVGGGDDNEEREVVVMVEGGRDSAAEKGGGRRSCGGMDSAAGVPAEVGIGGDGRGGRGDWRRERRRLRYGVSGVPARLATEEMGEGGEGIGGDRKSVV